LGAHARDCVGTAASDPDQGEAGNARALTLFAWKNAVSPHLAVKLEGRLVSDAELVAAIADALRRHSPGEDGRSAQMVLLETAGGPCSPAPSGTLQVKLIQNSHVLSI
jgi:dethiobiotin synthetase/adenosylmethionine--8-amino-7-oxononanoate aminotransferase